MNCQSVIYTMRNFYTYDERRIYMKKRRTSRRSRLSKKSADILGDA